jgi:hypothetical protein
MNIKAILVSLVITLMIFIISGCGEDISAPEYNPSFNRFESSNSLLTAQVIYGNDLFRDSMQVYIGENLITDDYIVESNTKKYVFYYPHTLFSELSDSTDLLTSEVYIVYADDTLYSQNIVLSRVLTNDTIVIGAGTFTRGWTQGNADERPESEVTITEDMTVMAYEVPMAFRYYLDGNVGAIYTPEAGQTGPWQPISGAAPQEAMIFANELSDFYGFEKAYTEEVIGNDTLLTWDIDADGWRLPTEAEWEFIALSNHSRNITEDELGQFAWYIDNSGGNIKEVGQKQAGREGVYDLLGNVWEWCYDAKTAYSGSPVTDPHTSPIADTAFVRRGGGILSGPFITRTTNRFVPPSEVNDYSNTGIRLIRNVK